jgi:lysosomal alpha-mannosidase
LYLDRSEGGSSIKDGSIEIMLHRRILHDDFLGVGESLNETAYGKGLVVRGRHSLILEPPTTSALIHRTSAQRIFMHTLSTYALPQLSYADYSNKYRQTWSALSNPMPVNVHLLTFDQLESKQYLVRIEHFFELNEDAVYSQPVTFDLQSLFNSLGTIKDLLELTLSANFPLADLHRLVWVTDEGEVSDNASSKLYLTFFEHEILNNVFVEQSPLTGTIVTLNPMQIRTFQVTLQ